jgi:hypothetical protein
MYPTLQEVKKQNPGFYRELVRDLLHSCPCSMESYLYMRQIYVATAGQFNKEAAQLYCLFNPKTILPPSSGILLDDPTLANDHPIAIGLSSLRTDGIYKFPKTLNSEKLLNIRNSIFRIPILNPSSNQLVMPQELLVHQKHQQLTYQVNSQQLLHCHEVQELLLDESILFLVQEYLGCTPILCSVLAWFSFPGSDSNLSSYHQALSRAAQQFHFDMDQIRFIKIFLYLSDVTDKNGPFVYVTGSHEHKMNNFRDGRYEDSEIINFYGSHSLQAIEGSAGTIFAADTCGFHKGTPLQSSHRLILQIVYGVSLFGAEQQHSRIPVSQYGFSFADQIKSRGRAFSGYFDIEC